MKIAPVLAHLSELELGLADELEATGERHAADHDVYHQCHSFARQCRRHAERLASVAARYEAQEVRWGSTISGGQSEPVPLLGDLRTLFLRAEECSITGVMAGQAAQAARDQELLDVVRTCHTETEVQVKWLVTRIKTASPQALVVG